MVQLSWRKHVTYVGETQLNFTLNKMWLKGWDDYTFFNLKKILMATPANLALAQVTLALDSLYLIT